MSPRGADVRVVAISLISSAPSDRALSRLYNQHIRNRTTQAGLRWPLFESRPEGLFCASLMLGADREQRRALFFTIQLGATFALHHRLLLRGLQEWKATVERQKMGCQGKFLATILPFSSSSTGPNLFTAAQIIVCTQGDKILICLTCIFHFLDTDTHQLLSFCCCVHWRQLIKSKSLTITSFFFSLLKKVSDGE